MLSCRPIRVPEPKLSHWEYNPNHACRKADGIQNRLQAGWTSRINLQFEAANDNLDTVNAGAQGFGDGKPPTVAV